MNDTALSKNNKSNQDGAFGAADRVSQDQVNKALWNACDTFRGTISADTYKDFILTIQSITMRFKG